MDVEEHVKAIFNGETLPEAFQAKVKTIFEGAVRTKTVEYARNLKARYNKKLRAAKQSIQESLVDKLDGYFDYIVEEWMTQNKLAVEHSLRTEITEEFVTDLRSLFESHNIMIPKGKENLVESLASKLEATKKELNEEINKNATLKKRINESKKNEILRTVCEGLAETEIEKLKKLAEKVQYSADYQKQLEVLKENYFPKKVASKKNEIEEIKNNEEPKKEVKKQSSSDVAKVASILNKLR